MRSPSGSIRAAIVPIIAMWDHERSTMKCVRRSYSAIHTGAVVDLAAGCASRDMTTHLTPFVLLMAHCTYDVVCSASRSSRIGFLVEGFLVADFLLAGFLVGDCRAFFRSCLRLIDRPCLESTTVRSRDQVDRVGACGRNSEETRHLNGIDCLRARRRRTERTARGTRD